MVLTMNKNDRTLEELYETIATPLEMFYQFEQSRANETCFVQPYPDQSIIQYSWAEAGRQIRSMAAYLKSLELSPGSNSAKAINR